MTCARTGKVTYATWKMAERVAQGVRRRREGNVAPYRCNLCNGYHAGSSQSGRDYGHRKAVLRKIEDRERTVEW